MLALTVSAHAAESGKQAPLQAVVEIPLESIGAHPVSQNFLMAGASMLTVNLIDDTHLLVTFATRDLVPRIPGDPPTDDDRIVAGEVVELPGGKVLAQTKWHLHDHGRYLWSIGDGHYILRIRNELSVFSPLLNLHTPDPFQRVALPHTPGTPLGVTSSADHELVSIITQLPPPKQNGPTVLFDDNSNNKPKPTYEVEYFRVHGDGTVASPLQLTEAGRLRADIPLLMPTDADGYLWADETGRDHWAVTFNDFDGKEIKAGQLDSSCPPRMQMVSHVEYVALTCRGNDDSPKLSSLGLDGHETWEENFGSFIETPAFIYAPAAGRFAMLRTGTSVAPGDGATDSTTTQDFRVYQTESGDLIADLPISPVFRVPENVDLSESGRTVAVVHDDEIAIFNLPPPSKADLDALAFVQKFRPPATDGGVSFPKLVAAVEQASAAAAAPRPIPPAQQQALATPVSTTTAAAQPLPTHPGSDETGGAVPGVQARTRPTLLLPGEKPEFRDKNAPPQ